MDRTGYIPDIAWYKFNIDYNLEISKKVNYNFILFCYENAVFESN